MVTKNEKKNTGDIIEKERRGHGFRIGEILVYYLSPPSSSGGFSSAN
jgi:hypothetical protein